MGPGIILYGRFRFLLRRPGEPSRMKKGKTVVKSRPAIAVLACLAAFWLASCMSDNEKYIQGTWQYDDWHLAEVVSESDLTIIWFFSAGTFTYQACCFNADIEFGGRYRILESTEEGMVLELYNTYGTGTQMDGQVWINFDREAGTLEIQGAEPFYKKGP